MCRANYSLSTDRTIFNRFVTTTYRYPGRTRPPVENRRPVIELMAVGTQFQYSYRGSSNRWCTQSNVL
jgi:hypothetical protein